MLSNWDYNTQTVNGTLPLNNSSTAADDEFFAPRISGPVYYDAGSPSPVDPICVVVVNDNDGNFSPARDKVSSWKYYHSSFSPPGPVIEKLNITDYNSGFYTNGQTAIMPVVTGVGELVAGLAGMTDPYSDYPVVFYSDLDNVGPGGSGDGDFYAFGFDMSVLNDDPTLFSGTDYWEVNYDPISNSSSDFTLATDDKPTVAIATANNSGYEMITTYYEGAGTGNLKYMITGQATPYGFKPGRPAGIQQAGIESIKTYPNPVSNLLNIRNADGATYTVTDMAGRTIVNGTLSGDKATISTASLSTGVYLLHLTKDSYTETVKFTKQ